MADWKRALLAGAAGAAGGYGKGMAAGKTMEAQHSRDMIMEGALQMRQENLARYNSQLRSAEEQRTYTRNRKDKLADYETGKADAATVASDKEKAWQARELWKRDNPLNAYTSKELDNGDIAVTNTATGEVTTLSSGEAKGLSKSDRKELARITEWLYSKSIKSLERINEGEPLTPTQIAQARKGLSGKALKILNDEKRAGTQRTATPAPAAASVDPPLMENPAATETPGEAAATTESGATGMEALKIHVEKLKSDPAALASLKKAMYSGNPKQKADAEKMWGPRLSRTSTTEPVSTPQANTRKDPGLLDVGSFKSAPGEAAELAGKAYDAADAAGRGLLGMKMKAGEAIAAPFVAAKNKVAPVASEITQGLGEAATEITGIGKEKTGGEKIAELENLARRWVASGSLDKEAGKRGFYKKVLAAAEQSGADVNTAAEIIKKTIGGDLKVIMGEIAAIQKETSGAG